MLSGVGLYRQTQGGHQHFWLDNSAELVVISSVTFLNLNSQTDVGLINLGFLHPGFSAQVKLKYKASYMLSCDASRV